MAGKTQKPVTVVLFGATGDLARRKLLPGLLHLFETGLLPQLRIVGTSLDDHTTDSFVAFVHEAVKEFSGDDGDMAAWPEFSKLLHWAPGTEGASGLRAAVEKVESAWDGDRVRLHYLSVPPKAALSVVKTLDEAELAAGSRIIMEKPFGVDLATAKALNGELHKTFDESQIYRIDHFLGKEAAQNILAFRFANGLFEPIWHRNNIDHVQIDVPEELGLDQRANFYESTGAYKDMVVTHLFQVLAFTAMEPPTSLAPDAINEEKNKVFRSMLPIDPANVVRGQYQGYRDIEGVASDSETETFIALKCFIDNWRWAGVPFYLRTGKRLGRRVTEVAVVFKRAPHLPFSATSTEELTQNALVIRVQPDEGVTLRFGAKVPGTAMEIRDVTMDFAYGGS
ncbi:MAG TPA: glucose-6-phosphate dehydrogenase, partial [Nocardioides sp.]|nr:glucose-6-phosphate dehydrogenase [Nocardioides sp.]